MSMLPLGGILTSAAGAPKSQSSGTETERSQKDALAIGRQTDVEQMAERAAGIGQTNEDQESSERDADGRRPWELPAKRGTLHADDPPMETAARQSKDATGLSGNKLDLTG